MQTIKLQYPVEIGGAKTSELSMRRSKVKDRLAVSKMQGTDADKEIRLFANLCEVEPAVIEEMDEADYKKLQDTFTSFLG